MPGYQPSIEVSPWQKPLPHLRRVALVTGNYLNVVDGVAKTLQRLVQTLEALDVEVLVVAPHGEHEELRPGEQMLFLPSLKVPIQKGYRLALGLSPRVKAKLDAFSPQLIHVATPDIAGVMAAGYARKRGLPLVGTYHTNFATYFKYWGRGPATLTRLAWSLTERFYAPFDRVFVPTASIGEELVNRGVLQDFGILARGVEHHRFNPEMRSQSWRERHGIKAEEKAVLFCARVVWEKGLRTLVETRKRLQAQGVAHRFVVVGDGDQLGWLKSQLPDAVFTGYLTGEDLARAYASCDLFLYPSTTDTFGNVTLEAMASGLPVVGARAPGTRCLVVHDESGLLAEPDDAGSFTEAAAQLLTDDVYRRRLAQGALARAAKFHWSDILADFTMELDELVAPRRGPTALG